MHLNRRIQQFRDRTAGLRGLRGFVPRGLIRLGHSPFDIEENVGDRPARLKLVERGHLLPAGHAPGGPDVEEHHFAGKIGQGLVQPGYLGIPFELVRGLTETYRKNLPTTSKSDVVLGVHLHVARDREQAIDNGALALSSQAEVFLRGRLSRPVQTEQIQTYASKSASKEAFEKLHTQEKARGAVAEEGSNIMAVWGTPDDCIEKIKFHVDSLQPEQLMLAQEAEEFFNGTDGHERCPGMEGMSS